MRRVLLGAPHLVAAAPTITVLLAERDRLPARMASHFAADGTVDGYASRGALVAVAVGLGVGMAVVFALLAATSARSGAVSRWDVPRGTIALSWGVAALLGVIQYSAVTANLDHLDGTGVALPGWTIPAGLGAAVVAGAVGRLAAPRTPAAGREPAPAAAIPITATEQVSWSHTTTVVWLPVLGAVLLAGGVALVLAHAVGAGVTLVLVGALLLLHGRVRVTADRRGLTVVLGLVGFPRVHIAADDIVSAIAADVSPAAFGGWGYRFVPGGSGVILRSGPALIVTRRSGRRFTVSVDDAATGAGVLAGVTGRPC